MGRTRLGVRVRVSARGVAAAVGEHLATCMVRRSRSRRLWRRLARAPVRGSGPEPCGRTSSWDTLGAPSRPEPPGGPRGGAVPGAELRSLVRPGASRQVRPEEPQEPSWCTAKAAPRPEPPGAPEGAQELAGAVPRGRYLWPCCAAELAEEALDDAHLDGPVRDRRRAERDGAHRRRGLAHRRSIGASPQIEISVTRSVIVPPVNRERLRPQLAGDDDHDARHCAERGAGAGQHPCPQLGHAWHDEPVAET